MRSSMVLLFGLCAGCRHPHSYPPPPVVVTTPQAGLTKQAGVEPPAAPAPPAAIVEEPVAPVLAEAVNERSRAFIAETNARLRDAYFDYDRSGLRADAAEALRFDYELLRGLLADFPDLRVVVEGHCDERGSAEYNLALGDRRANEAIDYLVQLGLPAAKLSPVSYGRERPQCTEAGESCWQKNRRAHLMAVDRLSP